MTVPSVTAGQQLLYTDTNVHIAQTNANTTAIATNTSNITTLQGQVTGLNSAATDTHITSDGSGNETVVSLTAPNGVNYNVGRIKDINSGNFSASGTINHGLSGTPSNVLLTPSVNGSTFAVSAFSFTSTQFGATLSTPGNTDFLAYR